MDVDDGLSVAEVDDAFSVVEKDEYIDCCDFQRLSSSMTNFNVFYC